MPLKKKSSKYIDLFFKKYWADPVCSKVISAVIIAIGGAIITTIYISIRSVYEQFPFESITKKVFSYFTDSTQVNNFILYVCIFIIIYSLSLFISNLIKKINKKKIDKDEIDNFPRIGEPSIVLFSHRLASAFPGQRGLQWYDAKTAVKRLALVFKQPLKFEPIEHTGAIADPFWWFRAGRSMSIKQFEILSETKILLGINELEINRIAVYVSQSYYKCFIYVEAKGENKLDYIITPLKI